MKVICTRCGGTNIACEAIVNPNTGKIISRNMKIKAAKYRNDYRVWLDYAGDYRNENIE